MVKLSLRRNLTFFTELNCGGEYFRDGGTISPSKNRDTTKTFYNPLRKYLGDFGKQF